MKYQITGNVEVDFGNDFETESYEFSALSIDSAIEQLGKIQRMLEKRQATLELNDKLEQEEHRMMVEDLQSSQSYNF